MARIGSGPLGLLLACTVTGGVAVSDVDVGTALQTAQEAATSSSETTISEARHLVSNVLPVRPAVAPAMSQKAAEYMANHEVGSKKAYIDRYQMPVYPGGSSGPTVGIGYDLGTQTGPTIRGDWREHKDGERMSTASGKLGAAAARPWVAQNRDIRVTWDQAVTVYNEVLLPRYYAQAQRAFGRSNFDAAPQGVRDALTSLVYNRGPSMTGSRRIEMRRIRDECLPRGDWECVARNIENQCYLWQGQAVYKGLCGRRKHEANMARGKV